MRLIDLTGRRFGRLTVIERAKDKVQPNGNRRATWSCICDCGRTAIVEGSHLREGSVRSCGCLLSETVKTVHLKHGETRSRLYHVWSDMKQRCNNPKRPRYPIYGGRGIKVCPEWESSYDAFRDWAYATGYDPNAKRGECTLDRIDCDGDYEPSNCRWATMREQCMNRHPKGYLQRAGARECLA